MTTSRLPTRPQRHWLALGLLAIITTGWVVSCDQEEGQRCQHRDDCESPLTCNLATLTCTGKNTSGQIDATVPDGPPPDAAVDALPDSSIDGAIDAMIDAP
ncbi:MAG: hypothetical protein H0T42_19235 [Deltaproteobacteria bacterium]|nr:hypothetical protein [Deltaproteobacteria bacterium]